MRKILELDNNEFKIDEFDEVVATAFNPNSKSKNEAEEVLLQFKELPNSWTKIDLILKNSSSTQSKFIALQILEETVKSKWVLFNEEMKLGLKQYVFSTVVERSSTSVPTKQNDIILQKFNMVLVEIVKKEWPSRWPTFISDLINISQSTSMQVSKNSLVILKDINEQLFMPDNEISTIKKRKLRNALKQEYFTIFHFICLILEYSETQEVEDSLLESCLKAFESFCKSMSPEFIFSTKIIDYILGYLNSPHSLAAIDCLHEIVELRKNNKENNMFERTPELVELEKSKIDIIHTELLRFFEMYLAKFQDIDQKLSKLQTSYRRMDEMEKLFVRKYARIFSVLYSYWFYDLKDVYVMKGLGFLVQLTKIEDSDLFKDIFPTWAKIIYEMYSEHPLRIPTSKPLKRNNLCGIFQALLPVFITNMPRPEEVFIYVNDLGEIIKDKKVETSEIDFYKKMRLNIFYLSYCIEGHMLNCFIKKIEKLISAAVFDHESLNKVCWSIGSISNALEEPVERDFFVTILKHLLTMCEIRPIKSEKAIIASNIMFIVGQFYRFLKYHNEFLSVVVKKLFEFMEEDHEGIKEMACDNFYKICEKCPSQFFIKKDKMYFYESIINDLSSLTKTLEFYLQRIVIEGLLIVLKNSQKRDSRYIDIILSTMTNENILDERYISSIYTAIHDPNQLKMTLHLIESYSLVFKIVPDLFYNISVLEKFLYFYKHISSQMANNSCTNITNKNLQKVKTAISRLNEVAISSGIVKTDYLNTICENILLDYKNSLDPAILSLATAITLNVGKNLSNFDNPIEIQRQQFFISTLMVPSLQLVMNSDENPELSQNFLELFRALIQTNFKVFFPLLIDSPSYEPLVNSVLFSLTGLREISNLALDILKLFFQNSFENRIFNFFNRFYLITIENILGIIFDKDTRQNYDLQIAILYDLIGYINRIPSINNLASNYSIFRDFVGSLFSKNFRNLTEGSVKLFIEGILEIKNKECFKDHIDDFNIKIYEYGDDNDMQAELELLNERVSKSANQ